MEKLKEQVPFSEDLELWTAKFCRRNVWRVRGLCEFEDLFQDCVVKFLICQNKYPNLSSDNFDAFYKISVRNHVNDLSRKASESRAGRRVEEMTDIQIESAAAMTPEPVDYNLGEIAVIIQQAPAELKLLMVAVCEDGCSILHQSSNGLLSTDGRTRTRETTNQRLCRLLGLDSRRVDLRQMALQHILGLED